MSLQMLLLGGLGLLLLFFIIGIYNRLVRLKNQAHNALANIDVMLKKRYDLIPALVQSVKGYMQHESEVLEQLTELRAKVDEDGLSDEEKVQVNNQISKGLNRVLATVEAYPELRAGENVMHLQRSLAEIEEQISASRRSFNMAVTQLNTSIQSFPTNLIASPLGFREQELFEATAVERHQHEINLQKDDS